MDAGRTEGWHAGTVSEPTDAVDRGLRDHEAERGWRDYNRPLLAAYDRIVIGIVAKAVWRCPPERLLALYRDNIRPPHLDVGPGTGYGIDRSGLPDGSAVTLVDPNTAATLRTAEIVQMVDDLIEAHGDLIPEPIRRG